MSPQSTIADTVALKRLHDIVQPEAISWMPQTAGWYVLLFLFILLVIFFLIKKYRRYTANRYRRQALCELALIERLVSDPAQRVKGQSMIPVLLKRIALFSAPREEVAFLAGQEWLVFLDNKYHGNGFSKGPGKILPDLSYRETETSPEELTSLIELTRLWIKEHKSRG